MERFLSFWPVLIAALGLVFAIGGIYYTILAHNRLLLEHADAIKDLREAQLDQGETTRALHQLDTIATTQERYRQAHEQREREANALVQQVMVQLAQHTEQNTRTMARLEKLEARQKELEKALYDLIQSLSTMPPAPR